MISGMFQNEVSHIQIFLVSKIESIGLHLSYIWEYFTLQEKKYYLPKWKVFSFK